MANDTAGTLALLIDGDNASPKIVTGLLAEIASYGVASVKRIYGDWTGPNLKGWKACLLEHSIQPVQQFAYTTGKNATDGAMIIDAMDLLYTGRFSGFCIVSSDSDFARLAARLAAAQSGRYRSRRSLATARGRRGKAHLRPIFGEREEAHARLTRPCHSDRLCRMTTVEDIEKALNRTGRGSAGPVPGVVSKPSTLARFDEKDRAGRQSGPKLDGLADAGDQRLPRRARPRVVRHFASPSILGRVWKASEKAVREVADKNYALLQQRTLDIPPCSSRQSGRFWSVRVGRSLPGSGRSKWTKT